MCPQCRWLSFSTSGAYSLYGLDTELAKHLGLEKMAVLTGMAEFPFAWFYCDENAAARAQSVLTPSATFPLHSLTVLERASVAGVVAALEQPPPPPPPTWGAWVEPGNLGNGDACHAAAPDPAAAATPSPRRFWRCACSHVNEPKQTHCRKCDAQHMAAAVEASPNWTIGEWNCPSCGELNYCWRFDCYRCLSTIHGRRRQHSCQCCPGPSSR